MAVVVFGRHDGVLILRTASDVRASERGWRAARMALAQAATVSGPDSDGQGTVIEVEGVDCGLKWKIMIFQLEICRGVTVCHWQTNFKSWYLVTCSCQRIIVMRSLATSS